MEFLYKSCIDCEDHNLVCDGVDASTAETDRDMLTGKTLSVHTCHGVFV